LANLIPEEKVSEIKAAADIVDVISESVLLKQSGRNFLGLCPFHSEKTPSFTVSREKQIFYCFGCGSGGNVFTFLMKHDGLTFPESARQLARRYGVDIPERRMTPEQKRHISEKEKIFRINSRAADYFRSCLLDSVAGKRAAAYLQGRGMDENILKSFGIGYAPAGWDNLVKHLNRHRIPIDLALKSGLIAPRKNGNGHYDRFRNRVIFPIFNVSRQVVGFGGRVLDDSLPKYLNSPETPVYSKSRSLYGIDLAKDACRKTGTVYVVEGYFDVLALHQHGIRNAVATLGTSLTPGHVQMLRGYLGEAGRVILVYDSDAAGIKAAERSIEVFDKGYVDAQIMVLPAGHDPDSFLFEEGPDRFNAVAASAMSIIPFLTESAVAKYGLSVEGKVRVINALVDPLVSISDQVKRSLYVKFLAERLDIHEAALLERIRQTRPRPAPSPDGRGGRKAGSQEKKPTPSGRKTRIEKKIVSMMLQFPEILPEILRRRALDHFEDDGLKMIGTMIIEFGDNRDRMFQKIADRIPDGEAQVARLSIEDEPWNLKDGIKLLKEFVERSPLRPEATLNEAIKAAEAEKDESQVEKLLAEKQRRAVQREKEKMELRREG
jgi:DNA primase